MSQKDIIGRETRIDFGRSIQGVPAKIDTGADSSAIWASDIHIDNKYCSALFISSEIIQIIVLCSITYSACYFTFSYLLSYKSWIH